MNKLNKLKQNLEHTYILDKNNNITDVFIGNEKVSIGFIEEILNEVNDFRKEVSNIKGDK